MKHKKGFWQKPFFTTVFSNLMSWVKQIIKPTKYVHMSDVSSFSFFQMALNFKIHLCKRKTIAIKFLVSSPKKDTTHMR